MFILFLDGYLWERLVLVCSFGRYFGFYFFGFSLFGLFTTMLFDLHMTTLFCLTCVLFNTSRNSAILLYYGCLWSILWLEACACFLTGYTSMVFAPGYIRYFSNSFNSSSSCNPNCSMLSLSAIYSLANWSVFLKFAGQLLSDFMCF